MVEKFYCFAKIIKLNEKQHYNIYSWGKNVNFYIYSWGKNEKKPHLTSPRPHLTSPQGEELGLGVGESRGVEEAGMPPLLWGRDAIK